MKSTLRNFYFFISLFAIIGTFYGQDTIPRKPKFETSVYDYQTNALSPLEKKVIELKLLNYADTTSTQIVVVLIKSTNGQDINQYKVDLAQSWGIGQEDKDNGLLLLVAVDDKKIAIATGYGLEHLLPDALCKLIIDNEIAPEFKNGRYYDGIDKGTNAIINAIAGEYKAGEEKISTSSIIALLIIVGLFLALVIMAMFSKSKGYKGKSHSYTKSGKTTTKPARRGFKGGFGGGGFGGGGASGSW